MGGKLRRIVQDEGGLQIGLDDVFRRRQNIGDQVVAELDLVVERTAHLELGQPVNTGGNDSPEAGCGDQSKINIAREIVSRSFMAQLSGTRAKSAPNEISAIWLKIAFIRMGYCAWNRVGSG